MSEKFEPITSQDQLNKVIGDRISKLKAAHDIELEGFTKEINELKGFKEENLSLKEQIANHSKELEAKNTTIAGLNKEVGSYKLRNIKTKIALDKGLPISIAERLNGETEEDITKDAESMKALFENTQSHFITMPAKNTEPSGGNDEYNAYKEMLEKMNL